MFSVYILRSTSSGKLYIGHTNDIQDRLIRHNGNRVRATKNRGPWILMGTIILESRSKAILLEKHLKSMKNPAAVIDFMEENQ